MTQMSLFDGTKKFTVDKPIRLIELFAGYGSQHFALEYLGIPFESWRICEWAVKSIQAYKDLHFGNDNTDYSENMSYEELIEFLTHKGISANYNEPMSEKQIRHLGESRCRKIYNNIRATHNMVNVMQVHAEDLDITETDKYCYLLTYSFPCQDLSKAGLGKGMARDSGTRSGMLWQVERILDECTERPQILVMENVPDVIGAKNITHFAEWVQKLESLGYHNYWKVLNAKDYGIPQNRERCFMVSILGDYYYEFPAEERLTVRLKDILDKTVDEKYYLSETQIETLDTKTYNCGTLEARTAKNGIMPTLCARDYKDPKLVIEINGDVKCDQVGELCTGKWNTMFEMSRRVYGFDGISPTLLTTRDVNIFDPHFPLANVDSTDDCRVENDEILAVLDSANADGTPVNKKNSKIINAPFRIRKLTPIECWRLMGIKDEDYEKAAVNQSASSMYHLAGDSIVANVLMAIFKPMFE